jgi:hypothetical protein
VTASNLCGCGDGPPRGDTAHERCLHCEAAVCASCLLFGKCSCSDDGKHLTPSLMLDIAEMVERFLGDP